MDRFLAEAFLKHEMIAVEELLPDRCSRARRPKKIQLLYDKYI